jgi:hypothetical protein
VHSLRRTHTGDADLWRRESRALRNKKSVEQIQNILLAADGLNELPLIEGVTGVTTSDQECNAIGSIIGEAIFRLPEHDPD